jgi:RHS repeat-associated protein
MSAATTTTHANKFTGKERDGTVTSETGLDYVGARYDSSQFGRFMTPDPSGIDLADWRDPQQLNLYSYVRNNPITLTDPYGLDCAYLNDSGNGIESTDSNSISRECTGTGGYWVSGQVNQVSVNDNGTYQFGYNGVGANGSIQSITYDSYLSPQPGYCSGGDVICGGPGQVPQAIGNIQSANTANLAIGSIYGIGLKIGVGLVGGLADAGAENTAKVVFEQGMGHGARHLAGTSLQQAAVEKAITAEVQKAVAGAASSGNFWGKVIVDGQQILYKAWTLPNGTISVGTYYPVAP